MYLHVYHHHSLFLFLFAGDPGLVPSTFLQPTSKIVSRRGLTEAQPLVVVEEAGEGEAAVLCEQCETKPVEWFCPECESKFCDKCDKKMHRGGARKAHVRKPEGKKKQAIAAVSCLSFFFIIRSYVIQHPCPFLG